MSESQLSIDLLCLAPASGPRSSINIATLTAFYEKGLGSGRRQGLTEALDALAGVLSFAPDGAIRVDHVELKARLLRLRAG